MVKMPEPRSLNKPTDASRRRLKPGCSFPDIQTYRQTNGPLCLSRFRYGGLWITGVADTETEVIDNAQQFYMRETKQGREDSEII